jgi:hypothetical protein
MTPCSNCRHLGELALYREPLKGTRSLLCAECFGALTSMGITLVHVERRAVDLPVLHDRRRDRRPAWLARLSNKDMTERVA